MVKDAHDRADVLQDLLKINAALENIHNCNGLEMARKLDRELRIKYPCIDDVLNLTQAIPPSFYTQRQDNTGSFPEKEQLQLDYYGILCAVAVKKGIAKEVKDMMERVE